MKIFGIAYNYASYNNQALPALYHAGEPVVFTKADSALLKDHKPLFVPDFMGTISCQGSLVVRIGRLGKGIDERFAHRYYDAVTVGADFTARQMLEKAMSQGLPWSVCKDFDGSAMIGHWLSLDEAGPENQWQMRLDINGKTVQQAAAHELLWSAEHSISHLSRFYTLKTGDLIYLGSPTLGPLVKPEDHVEGFLGERKLLDFYCK